jgi:acetyl esterase/lipase
MLLVNLIQKKVFNGFFNPKRTNCSIFSKDKFKYPYTTNEFYVKGFKVFTIETQNSGNHHIIFLHGGAYISEPMFVHRVFAKKLALDIFKVTYIDYPLAPEYNASLSNLVIVKAFKQLKLLYPDDIFHILGDSAGGGLAVTMVKLLRDKKIPNRPKKIVLLSPWLDVSLTNESLMPFIKKEKMLPYEGLLYAGEKYAGVLDVKNEYVSPIYGNLNNLGEFLMFFGSEELFKPDCLKFVDLINNSKLSYIEYIEEKGLFHDYVLMPSIGASDVAYMLIRDFFLTK